MAAGPGVASHLEATCGVGSTESHSEDFRVLRGSGGASEKGTTG